MSGPCATLSVQTADDSAAESSTRGQRRAHLAPDVLRTLNLAAGSWALLRGSQSDDASTRSAIVQLWPRSGLEDDAITLPDCARLNMSCDTVDLYRFDADSSTRKLIKAITVSCEGVKVDSRDKREIDWIKASARELLVTQKYLSTGHQFFLADSGDERVWTITHLEPSAKSAKVDPTASNLVRDMQSMHLANGHAGDEVCQMDWRTKITIEGEVDQAVEKETVGTRSKQSKGSENVASYINLFTPSASLDSHAAYALLGGLEQPIKVIRSLLDLPLLHPELYTRFGLSPPRGILLHGPPGTGKTALARAVASSNPDCSCIVINGPELSSAYHGETEERLRGVFEEARKRSPCIVVLDEIDALCPRRDGDGGEVEKRVVATLLTLLDGMGQQAEERVFVIAATNRPNSVDPALRRPGRFDREIEIGIPDVDGRRQIIEILVSKMPNALKAEDITAVAARTHGYVGADLTSLIRESAASAILRWHEQPVSSRPTLPLLEQSDILHMLPSIRPSTMREVFVETAEVRWGDIGGQDEVKQKLRECVEWPLTHRDTFTRLGVEAPKGVLLYGPPGCSKTLTAKALATESGINFLAIKGPELLNKYVGESERAVREIFRKARAAAPSIILFDEIDALGSARTEDGHSGVLTTLLNEMDGVEELTGVTIVAATNRPDVLDSALMRPGRLDRILYVGPPDLQTRREIFKIRFAKMAIEPDISVEELAIMTEGCSGAEVASICQDAALAAMNDDINAPYVKRSHLVHSALTMRKRITPDMIAFFEQWRDQSGVRSA